MLMWIDNCGLDERYTDVDCFYVYLFILICLSSNHVAYEWRTCLKPTFSFLKQSAENTVKPVP